MCECRPRIRPDRVAEIAPSFARARNPADGKRLPTENTQPANHGRIKVVGNPLPTSTPVISEAPPVKRAPSQTFNERYGKGINTRRFSMLEMLFVLKGSQAITPAR